MYQEFNDFIRANTKTTASVNATFSSRKRGNPRDSSSSQKPLIRSRNLMSHVESTCKIHQKIMTCAKKTYLYKNLTTTSLKLSYTLQ